MIQYQKSEHEPIGLFLGSYRVARRHERRQLLVSQATSFVTKNLMLTFSHTISN